MQPGNIVMAGLVPAIRRGTLPMVMAGTDPRDGHDGEGNREIEQGFLLGAQRCGNLGPVRYWVEIAASLRSPQ